MSVIQNRAKELLPQVLLTLTSIIQALALEVLWSSVMDHAHLWEPGPARGIGWLQAAAVLEMIILVWVFYIHLVLRFRWVPTVRDSIVPFGFGVGQFALARMLGPEQLHLWFLLAAGLFGFAQWTTQGTFWLARQDRDNDWFFDHFRDSPLVRHAPWVATTLTCAALSLWVANVGPGGRVAQLGIILMNALVVSQIALQHLYWTRSLHLDVPLIEDQPSEPPSS